MIAAEFMSRDLVTIAPDRSVDEAAALMLEEGITGLPVVRSDGRLVGLVSMIDLLAGAVEDPGRPEVYRDMWRSLTRHREHLRAMDETTRVQDVMSDRVHTVGALTPLAEAARILLDEEVHRVVVVDERGLPVGILSSTDLVRAARQLLTAPCCPR